MCKAVEVLLNPAPVCRAFWACLVACFLLTPSLLAAPLRVALYVDAGSDDQGVPRVRQRVDAVPGLDLTPLKAEQIRAGTLKGFDVIIFPGGNANRQARCLGKQGRSEVRNFVERGGGYVGICAGAYLVCDGFSWGLKMLNAKTVSSKWQRGAADVKMQLTDEGRRIIGGPAEEVSVRYVNGPIIEPASNEALPAFKTLASFRTEVAKHGTPKGVMINAPAAVAAEFGKGRVIAFSPHPEQSLGLENLVARAIEWAGKRRD